MPIAMIKLIKSSHNTLYLNFKAFSFKDAMKFPIVCGADVCCGTICRNRIEFQKGVSFKRITIGRTKGSFLRGNGNPVNLCIGGKSRLVIEDTLDIPCGSVLNLKGHLEVGKGFKPNCFFLLISCDRNYYRKKL